MAAKLKTSGDFEGTANAGKQEWGGKGDYSWIGFTNSENVGGDMKTSLAVSISNYLLGKISNYLAAWRIDTFMGARYNVVSGPMAYKYEYYYEPPSKVLLKGEKKADLKKETQVRNEAKRALLGFTDVAEKHEKILKDEETKGVEKKEKFVTRELKALKSKVSTADYKLDSSGGVQITGFAKSSKIALVPNGITLKNAGASIFVTPGGIVQKGPIIRLG